MEPKQHRKVMLKVSRRRFSGVYVVALTLSCRSGGPRHPRLSNFSTYPLAVTLKTQIDKLRAR
ncbi:protein of unknown function [Hyphomicrobium sp. MC1]|nr:protein of unknown function [Hyphomicrobium sp. MC1]